MNEDFGIPAGEAVLKELAAVRPFLNGYSQWSDKMHAGKFNELATEVGKRVQQLQSLLLKVVALLHEAKDIHTRLDFPQIAASEDAQEAISAWEERMKQPTAAPLPSEAQGLWPISNSLRRPRIGLLREHARQYGLFQD